MDHHYKPDRGNFMNSLVQSRLEETEPPKCLSFSTFLAQYHPPLGALLLGATSTWDGMG